MTSRPTRKVLLAVVALDFVYILFAIVAVLHTSAGTRWILLYIACVFGVDWVLLVYWGKSHPTKTSRLSRVLRFCAWTIVLVNVPMLALAIVEQPSTSLMASLVFSAALGCTGLWIANAGVNGR